MNRTFTGLMAAVVLGGSSFMAAAAPVDAPAADVTVLDEAHFLAAADASVKRGDKEGAVQLFQSAIIYAPGDPVPYERLAHFYADNGQLELATQFFSAALDVQPAYAPALQGLAFLALASGNRAGAQAQRDLLVRSCGQSCPETTQVEKALSESAAAPSGSGR